MAIIDIIAPVFGIMVLGFAAARLRLVGPDAVNGLVQFVFNVALPVFLFRSLAQTELPAEIEWRFLLSFYGGSLAVYALAMGAGRFLFNRPLDAQAVFGMSAGFSNAVLLGIPILLTAFGPEASVPVFLLVALHSPTLVALTVTLIHTGQGGRAHRNLLLRSVFRDLARTPILMGLLAGLAANLAGLSLPGPVDAAAGMLAAVAAPCALFALGGSLAAYPLRGDLSAAILLVVLKLAVHPLLVWVLAVPVLGLEGAWVAVAVTMAAMPSGMMAYLFGARYEAASGVAARTVFLSTTISVLTISAVLYLVQA